jgi:hypothetical protein
LPFSWRLRYPALATAFPAGWGIDLAVGLRWLLYDGKSGTIARRTFIFVRFRGWPFHLISQGAGRASGAFEVLAGALPAVQYAVECKYETGNPYLLKMHQLASKHRRAGRSQRVGLALKPFGDAGNNVVLGFA